MPSFVAGDALRAGRVRRVLQSFETEPYAVHALYPHSRHLAGKVRVLVEGPDAKRIRSLADGIAGELKAAIG